MTRAPPTAHHRVRQPGERGTRDADHGVHIQLLRRGIASTVYCVVEGAGATQIIGDVRIEWSRNDVFVIPGWEWHEHINGEQGDSVLYSVSDAPVFNKLALNREQGLIRDGDVVEIRG